MPITCSIQTKQCFHFYILNKQSFQGVFIVKSLANKNVSSVFSMNIWIQSVQYEQSEIKKYIRKIFYRFSKQVYPPSSDLHCSSIATQKNGFVSGSIIKFRYSFFNIFMHFCRLPSLNIMQARRIKQRRIVEFNILQKQPKNLKIEGGVQKLYIFVSKK